MLTPKGDSSLTAKRYLYLYLLFGDKIIGQNTYVYTWYQVHIHMYTVESFEVLSDADTNTTQALQLK